jgi:hypothetical protein
MTARLLSAAGTLPEDLATLVRAALQEVSA